jgi:DNA polymerase-3 subunit epsilon
MPLVLVRPLVGIDCEATGPDQAFDRAIEVAALVMRPDGTRTPLRWRINPGRPIPAESTAVHRITDADVADAPPFEEVAAEILDALTGVDLVGYNLRAFDIPLLREEFRRCGITWAPGGHVADAYVVFKERERHTLSTAVRWYCGRELVDAHSAVADAEAALDVLLAQLERYPDLPRDLAALDVATGGRQPD